MVERASLAPVLAGLAAVLAVAVFQFFGFVAVDRLGMQAFDAFQRAAPREYRDTPVKVVDIDEDSIEKLGQWPWPRTELAALNDRLAAAGATAIAYDIVFSEPDRTSPALMAERLRRTGGEGAAALAALEGLPDNDAVLAESFAAAPVVNGFFLLNEVRGGDLAPKAGFAVAGTLPEEAIPKFFGAVVPMPRMEAASRGLGSLTITETTDGITRRAPLLALKDGQLLPALSLEAVRVARGAEAIRVNASDSSVEGGAPGSVVSILVGDLEIPTTATGALWSYFTTPEPARTVPAWEVLDAAATPEALAERFGGRIVFVGTSATGLRDLVSTPLRDRELGVMVHAQAAEQMILGEYLQRPDWGPGLEMALVLLLGGALALFLPRLGATGGAVAGFAALVAIVYGSWFAFTRWNFLLDPTYPILALLAVYVVQTVFTFYREERKRAYIHNAFDRYLSPDLVKRIAADPEQLELGGQERDMTVLFCDIRGFSGISEHFDPQELIDFLIGFLTPMCDVLLDHKATIDKFIGDAILAFWNAPLDDPEHHRNAARAALAMIDRLHELNRDMPGQAGQAWPGDVQIGIGLNSGLCCVGNMGSAQRLSYSLIGDTVNTASRFEGLTKQYDVQIIAGEALARELDGFAVLELDRVRVVGRETPETIFALVGDEDAAQPEHFTRLRDEHGEMLAAYRAGEWDRADALLDRLQSAYERNGAVGIYTAYRQRIAGLRADPPPPDWDGVYRANVK